MLAWTEQEKCRDLFEQPKSYNIKLIIGITLQNVNHSSSPALERSVINDWGLNEVLQAPRLTLSFCSGSQNLVSCSVLLLNL